MMKRFSVAGLLLQGVFLGLCTCPNEAAAVTAGQIRGSIFADDNKNGVYDSGEHVASSATLFRMTDGKWTAVGTPYTVVDGQFVFQNLPPGSYRVQLEFPDGAKRTSQNLEVTSSNTLIDIQVPLARNPGGLVMIPDTYESTDAASGGFSSDGSQGRRNFVNISSIIDPEISPFKP